MDLFKKTKISKDNKNDDALQEASRLYNRDRKVIEASYDSQLLVIFKNWFEAEKSNCESYFAGKEKGADEFVRGQYNVAVRFLTYLKNMGSV